MVSIKSLVAATICALAFSAPAAAGQMQNGADMALYRVSWSDVISGKWLGPAFEARRPDTIEVIEIGLDPAAAKVPGAIAAVLPEYDEVLDAVRGAVAKNPVVSSTLEKRGLSIEDVLGVVRKSDGVVSVFVGSLA